MSLCLHTRLSLVVLVFAVLHCQFQLEEIVESPRYTHSIYTVQSCSIRELKRTAAAPLLSPGTIQRKRTSVLVLFSVENITGLVAWAAKLNETAEKELIWNFMSSNCEIFVMAVCTFYMRMSDSWTFVWSLSKR